MKRILRISALVALLLLPGSVFAQSGAISGYVTNANVDPVDLARVMILGTTEAAIAGSDGFYSIDGLAPGVYDISVNHSAYHTTIIADIVVVPDSTNVFDIILDPPQTAEIAHANMGDDEIWLSVNIDNSISVSEFEFLIKWPSDYLSLESVEPSNRTDQGYLSYIIGDAGPGTVRIHWVSGVNGPMPAGSGPAYFMHFPEDSTLYFCDILPVFFTGSLLDYAVYDSSGNPIILDNLFSGSITKVDPQSYGCYDPDFNGWGLDIGDLIIVADRLVLGYGVWKISPAQQEAMADANGNGFVDAADIVALLNLIEGNLSIDNFPLLRFPAIEDPGIRDAIILGNLDGSPVVGYPGQTVEIPVFVRTDEEIETIALRTSANTSMISEILDVELTPELSGWEIGLSPEADFQPGFRGKTATANSHYTTPLNTNGQWSEAIAYFTLRLADHGFGGGESIRLKARASVVDSNYVVYEPLFIEGSILVELAECDYVFGDANSDGSFNGLDVVFSVSYFKGQGQSPPTGCYCGVHGFYGANADSNGDCLFNGMDVVYSVSALKGNGPMPVGCPDCP